MPNHERFEELCALAASGEISLDEQRELAVHLETCASCGKALEDMEEIHATWLPERPGFEIKRSYAAESKLRRSILDGLKAEGAEFSNDAQLPLISLTQSQYRTLIYRALALAAALLLLLAGVKFLYPWSTKRISAEPKAVSTSNGGVENSVRSDREADQVATLRKMLRQDQTVQQKLETTLKQVQWNRDHLQAQLSDTQREAEAEKKSHSFANQEIANLRLRLDAALAKEVNIETEFASVKTATSDKQAQLNLAESENNELRNKLAEQTASVEREHELMADGREIRDLIAARNLHIIDVYDTSGEGRTQKSFGRVFYTEGKSLVFYAYDLPARRPMTEYAYYAWGKRDLSGDVKVRSLGIFYNDDQAQRRWVLKITDPIVLSQIDSVFVTLEKTDDSSKTPTGKKLLSAYLGSPANHP